MIEDDFEWNDEKAGTNFAKHKIRFEQAKGVFRDSFSIDLVDDEQDYGEDRYILIGMTEEKLLVVAYTERKERIRIISAREALPHERRCYHEENS